MNLKRIYIVLCAVLLVVGCQRNTILDYSAEGNVTLKVSTNSRTAEHSIETKASVTDLMYRLTILDADGNEVDKYDDCSQLENIKLSIGDYKFIVESGEDNAVPTIDAPYYYGEAEVSIEGGKSVAVQITAKLANARVSAEYSSVLLDESLFSKVEFSIGDAVLTREMVENGSSIFVDDEMDGFTWRLDVTNSQGTESFLSQERRTIEECAHYTFSFDVDMGQADSEGNLGIELKVDNVVTVYDDEIEINIEKKVPPTLSTVGFVDGEQAIVKDVVPREAQFEFHFDVYAGTKEITVRHESDALEAQGIPRTMNLSELSQSVITAANSAGIQWTTPVYEDPDPVVSFTEFAKSASLGEYSFFVELIDKDDQFVEGQLNFVVLPDMDHLPIDAQYGAKYAMLNGEWCTLEKPEGLSFQYRVKGQSDWVTVDESRLEVTSEELKTYTAHVVGLSPLTTYEWRTYSTAAQYEDRIMEFTTYDAPEIPNLDFEDGYYDGKAWYPNATGGNSYWATGNNGLVDWPVSSTSNTYHTDDAVSGKAVCMESVKIGISVSPVKFAAGNIFTGKYSTNMSDPASSAQLGRPYTGRPLQLKGWYKYYPENINNDKNSVSGDGYGKPDYCHIYISLEDWGSADSRPSSPRIIGYGEFKTNQTVDTYTQFEIDVEYYEERTPTHVIITATSSHLGVEFAGGDGSKLYVDEFELVWE